MLEQNWEVMKEKYADIIAEVAIAEMDNGNIELEEYIAARSDSLMMKYLMGESFLYTDIRNSVLDYAMAKDIIAFFTPENGYYGKSPFDEIILMSALSEKKAVTMSLREEMRLKKKNENDEEGIRASDGSLIVGKDYTIEDVEQYVMDNVFKLKKEFLEKNNSVINNLIKEKDNHHILANWSIYGHQLEEFFVDRYYENFEPFLWYKEIEKYFSNFHGLATEKYKEFKLKKSRWKHEEHYFTFYTKLENSDFGDKMSEKIKENAEEWQIVVKKYFDPVVAKLNFALKAIPVSQASFVGYTGISGYEGAMAIHKSNDKKKRLESAVQMSNLDKMVDGVFFLPEDHIILIKANMICVVRYGDELSIADVAVFGLNGKIELKDIEGKVYPYDATIRPTYKPKSVVGHAVMGQLIGGTVGGVIGALSAVEANSRQAEAVANYNPLNIDIKFDQIDLCLLEYTTLSYARIYSINKTLLAETELNQIINALSNARTHSACLQGELIKEFILDSPSKKAYSEKEFKIYEKRKTDDLKCLLAEKYTELAQDYQKEKAIREELDCVIMNASEALNRITKTYDKEKIRIETDIKDLEVRLGQLGFFKGTEKRKLNSQIEALKAEKQLIEEKYKTEKSMLDKERDDRVKELNMCYEKYREKFSPAILYENCILEEQGREYEKHIFIQA